LKGNPRTGRIELTKNQIKPEGVPVNKFNSMFGQVLQIFSKREFYSAVKETGAEKEQPRDILRNDS